MINKNIEFYWVLRNSKRGHESRGILLIEYKNNQKFNSTKFSKIFDIPHRDKSSILKYEELDGNVSMILSSADQYDLSL